MNPFNQLWIQNPTHEIDSSVVFMCVTWMSSCQGCRYVPKPCIIFKFIFLTQLRTPPCFSILFSTHTWPQVEYSSMVCYVVWFISKQAFSPSRSIWDNIICIMVSSWNISWAKRSHKILWILACYFSPFSKSIHMGVFREKLDLISTFPADKMHFPSFKD